MLCLWYKCYVPHYPCRLIARQYKVEIRIYYIDHLGKFDYGPAHASRNHRYTYVCQQIYLFNIAEPVQYKIYALALPFDLRCESGTLQVIEYKIMYFAKCCVCLETMLEYYDKLLKELIKDKCP